MTDRARSVSFRGSGVRSALAHFDAPSGGGINGLVVLERIEETDGVSTFAGSLEVPAVVGRGIWTLSLIEARDGFGNTARWGKQALARRGLTVQFEATAPGGA